MGYCQESSRKVTVFLGRSLPLDQRIPCREGLPRYFSLFTPALRCACHTIIGASLFAIAVNSPPARSAPSHSKLESDDHNIILSFNPSSYDVVIALENGLSFSEVKLIMPSARLISYGSRKYALLRSFGNSLSARTYGLSLAYKVPWPLDLLIHSAPVKLSPNPARYVTPYQAQSSSTYLSHGAKQAQKKISPESNKYVNQGPGQIPNLLPASIHTPSPKLSRPVDTAEPSSYAVETPATTSLEQSPEPVASEVALAQVAVEVGASPSTGSGQAAVIATEQKSAEVEPVVAVQQQVTVEQELVASSESDGVVVVAGQDDVESRSESATTSLEQSPEPVASEVALAQVAVEVGASPSTGSGQAAVIATEQKSAEVEPVVAVQQQVTVEQELVASSESDGVVVVAGQDDVESRSESATTSLEQSPEPVASEVALAQVAVEVGASPSTGSGQAAVIATEQKSAEVEPVVAVQQQVTVEQELVASSESDGVVVVAGQDDVESRSESATTSLEQSPEPVASEVALAQVAVEVGASPSTGSGQAAVIATEQKSAEVEPVVAVQQQVTVEQELVARSEDAVNRVIKDQNSVILNVEEQIANTIGLPLVSEQILPASITYSGKGAGQQSVNAIAMGHDSRELEASISHNNIADLTSFNSSQSLPISSESVSIDSTSSISPGSEKVSASASAAFKSPGFDHIKDLIYVIVDIHDSADLQIVQNLDTATNSFPLSRHSSLGLRKTILQAGVFNDSRIGRQLLNARLKELTNAGLHVRQLRGSELLYMNISIDPSTQINENS
ncbi:hypothetical protein [Synechococcus sp. HK01-R]|uniref:hypothetical protein n=1 Tax=Synechococcus sp. HK01-R TaxID=2751171 RepID=UPI0016283345|nr:hypothetical protein [Synechococcus sp. HK01-R]QNG27088.1 hypothetical protein H0O21_13150 [Synechococcus sp. HK01-R]